jgi:FkbM family methyltransferase
VSALMKVANIAGRLGLRPLVARAASLAYRGSDFAVDGEDRWINRQREATFVSPTFHTTGFSAVEAWVLDNWTWGYRPRPGDTVIDVGAGVGEEAVIFSKLVGESGRVISIEAHPRTFSCLEQTIARSGLHNVTALCCAVADEDGELFISDVQSHLSNSIVGQSNGTRVRARSLDSIAAELGLGDIALIKMNIEGAERLAVDGMTSIAPQVRNAVISCHDFVADFFGGGPELRTKEHVRRALEAQGFALATRADPPNSWVRDYLYAHRPTDG